MNAGRLYLTAMFMLLPATARGEEKKGPDPRRIVIETTDGVEIVADYFAPKIDENQKAPCAVLIHMFPAERTSWRPLVPYLHEAGFAVLAYDIRGAGESIRPREKHLRRLYSDRDADLFAAAWQDADAVVRWLRKRKECDASHIAMIGASIGCSISIDYAGRDKSVKTVVCLSPGTNYMGIDSVSQIKKLGKRPILIVAPEGERAAPEALTKAAADATMDIRPGDYQQHGTRMFEAEYGTDVMKKITAFATENVRPTETKASESSEKE
jgi:dienelactone hydrolase